MNLHTGFFTFFQRAATHTHTNTQHDHQQRHTPHNTTHNITRRQRQKLEAKRQCVNADTQLISKRLTEPQRCEKGDTHMTLADRSAIMNVVSACVLCCVCAQIFSACRNTHTETHKTSRPPNRDTHGHSHDTTQHTTNHTETEIGIARRQRRSKAKRCIVKTE